MDSELLTVQRAIGGHEAAMRAHRFAVNRTWTARRQRRRLASLETNDVDEESAAVGPEAERNILAASIEAATAQLSPGARAVFVMHDVEGFTHEEIAAALGITAGGSKSQLFKARAKLRKLLAHLIDAPMSVRDIKGTQHAAPRRARHRGCTHERAPTGDRDRARGAVGNRATRGPLASGGGGARAGGR